MNDWDLTSFKKEIEKIEIENKKLINEKGFNNQYDFSVYEFLRKVIPGMIELDNSHLKKDDILIIKFYNSEFEYNFFTCREIFIYPEMMTLYSIPKVESYKKEIINYYKLKKSDNSISKITYNLKNREIKETTIDSSALEREINSQKESLKEVIKIERYESDFKRNPGKYREIDSLFERKAAELGKEFVKNFFSNRLTQEITEVFDTKILEKEIIVNLPKGFNYFKYRNFIGSNFSGRVYSGHVLLEIKRIDKSITYFYLFWNKNLFYIKSYIASIYSKNFKLENILIIDSLFSELNKDRNNIIDTYLQGDINEHIFYYSRKEYNTPDLFKIEFKKLENILNNENNQIEEGEENVKKEEKRIEDLKFIQSIFNK
ncbi:hypothetical protein ACPUEN_08450 [Algoriphagus yeomjeoni]|uniref:hypothetical protein n=1 Tax=Algoriphagus yeomjeoni TaxID=291403 RepID=UPI003CE5437F